MCGHGTTIGGQLTDFHEILRQIPQEYHSRIGICLDTCHSFAAGYDLASPAGFDEFMAEFDRVIGLRFLRALHLNDSRAPRGSKRDLHANIGTGFLGLRAFHNVMNEPRFEHLPMILETPIDRPAGEVVNQVNGGGQQGEEEEEEEDYECGSESEAEEKKKKKKPRKKSASTTVPDPGVWAREIKLLESLIDMDPEGKEFKGLEKQLSDRGSEMRRIYQDQYDRKLEAEEKQRNKKEKDKNQNTLVNMMKNAPKRRGSAKKQPESQE